MNNAQKRIIGVAGTIGSLIGVCPPWVKITRIPRVAGVTRTPIASYFLFYPPSDSNHFVSFEVDTQRLLIEWFVVAVITSIVLLFVRKKSNG
jgi:hypothetical protein